MALPHAKSGEVNDVRPLGAKLGHSRTTTLVKTDDLEVVRLVLPAGKTIATHPAPGDTLIQCLEGVADLVIDGWPSRLQSGEMIYLSLGQRHSLRAAEDTSLLLTMVPSDVGTRQRAEMDWVQEASEESFPASDPPARTPITGP